MTLERGFITKQTELKELNFLGGLLLWITSCYIYYAFFQLFREAFRYFSGNQGDQILLILTPHENYLYNVFYASIASALGFFISIRFFLQNSVNKNNNRTKALIRRTLNAEGFNSWSFLLWFVKLGGLLGIWYMMYAMNYDIDFLNEVPILLLLLPIVLFYSIWPNISRLFKTQKTKWFLRITSVHLIMAFGLAFVNFTDYQTLNEKNLQASLLHTYNLEVPLSQSQDRIIQIGSVVNLFVVRDTIPFETPVIFIENNKNRVKLENLQIEMGKEFQGFYQNEIDLAIINLHIDSKIYLRQLTPIIDELRKHNHRVVQFSTGRKYSRYPAHHPIFKYQGIGMILPGYSDDLVNFLDSVEQIDLKGKRLQLFESNGYRHQLVKRYNRIEVEVYPDYTLLNNEKLDSQELEQMIYYFAKKYAPDYVIILNPNEGITYGRYIEIMDLLHTQVDRLRNELSYAMYNQPYSQWYEGVEMDSIRRKYPRKILQWTTEEQRLNELLKKTRD